MRRMAAKKRAEIEKCVQKLSNTVLLDETLNAYGMAHCSDYAQPDDFVEADIYEEELRRRLKRWLKK